MINPIILSAFSFLTIFSCVSQKKNASTNTNNDQPKKELSTENIEKMDDNKSQMQNLIYLNEGENKFFKEFEMNVGFQKVTEDSRCPKDVQCVWSGVATAEIQFTGTYTRPVNVKISTIDDSKKGYSKSAVFNGYKISLVELNPYPKNASSKKADLGKHNITLQIVKIAGNQIEPGTR